MTTANPFRYGGVARDLHFANREDELRTLKQNIRSGQNVVVISPRRYGKTSLVDRAITQLRAQGILVAYLDLFRTPTKSQLADDLAQALYDGLVSRVERAIKKAVAFFSHLPVAPRFTVTEDGRPAVEFTAFASGEDLDKTLAGLLELPGRIATIDEGLVGVMRAILQDQDDVAHVFVGSKRHLMEMLFMDKTQHLYRAAKPLPVGPIAPQKFARFIRRRFDASDEGITDETVTRVLALTGGRPYETQALCSFVWEQAREEGAPATPEVLDRALVRLLEAESARATAVWDGLSRHQRALLRAVAAEGNGIYSEGYRRRHKLGSASSVTTSIKALEAKELAQGSGGNYEVADVFVGEWIRRSGGRPA